MEEAAVRRSRGSCNHVADDKMVKWAGRWELEMWGMMKLEEKLECITQQDKQTVS